MRTMKPKKPAANKRLVGIPHPPPDAQPLMRAAMGISDALHRIADVLEAAEANRVEPKVERDAPTDDQASKPTPQDRPI